MGLCAQGHTASQWQRVALKLQLLTVSPVLQPWGHMAVQKSREGLQGDVE